MGKILVSYMVYVYFRLVDRLAGQEYLLVFGNIVWADKCCFPRRRSHVSLTDWPSPSKISNCFGFGVVSYQYSELEKVGH